MREAIKCGDSSTQIHESEVFFLAKQSATQFISYYEN
jgi:hypothetical protein